MISVQRTNGESQRKQKPAQHAVQTDTDKRRGFGVRRLSAPSNVCRGSRHLLVRLNLFLRQSRRIEDATNADPSSALFIAAITAITTIVGTLVGQWAIARFASHNVLAMLQATNLAIQKELSDLHVKYKASEERSAELQTQYDQRFGREIVLAKHTFEQQTPIFASRKVPSWICESRATIVAQRRPNSARSNSNRCSCSSDRHSRFGSPTDFAISRSGNANTRREEWRLSLHGCRHHLRLR